jgi:hypothetical protein
MYSTAINGRVHEMDKRTLTNGDRKENIHYPSEQISAGRTKKVQYNAT